MSEKIIFKIQEPSEDDLRKSSARWLECVGPTLIDNWPEDLLALSAPTLFVDLPKDIAVTMFDIGPQSVGSDAANEIDAKLGWERRFFRLNSRSPKDAPFPFELPLSCSGKEMLQVMSCSERMLNDLCYFHHSTATPKLCLREFWPGVRPLYEYRCFVKDRKILAVAEYANCQTELWSAPLSCADAETRANIDIYLNETVLPRLHIDTVVVDIFVGPREMKLIEINPFGSSDPVGAQSYKAIENGIPGIARLSREPLPRPEEIS